jgi:hypothetical protein
LAASLYLEYRGIKAIFWKGNVGGGLLLAGVLAPLAASVVWLVSIPGAALMALSERLMARGESAGRI